MSILTVDASVAASWLIPTQSTERSRALEAALDSHSLQAPQVFVWEIRNVLLKQKRRYRDFDLRDGLLRLDRYDIATHDLFDIDELTAIAANGQVSLFDAAYFYLAASDGSILATRDGGLLDLCQKYGVDHIDLR